MRKLPRPILVITNWRDGKHPDAGGAEVVCERLAASFVQRGHEVVLLSAAVAGEARKERIDGYWTIRRGNRFTVYPWALLWMVLHRRHIRGVVDSQNGIPFFTPLVVEAKTPVLMLLHHIHQDQFPLYFSPLISTVGKWLERKGSSLVYRDRLIVAVSPSTRKGARKRLGLKGEIVVIPPGSEAAVSSLSARRGRATNPNIVCVGRLVVHKKTASIIRAVPPLLDEFPSLELQLVGDGPERPILEALVKSLGLEDHVFLHGAVSTPERDRLMRTAWMSVNASEGEGWGLSVVEANAQGVPVLAFRRPGLRDSIRDGETGWLIDEDQQLDEAIARALRSVSGETESEAIGARSRQWASQFTWDEMANQVLGLLRAEEGRLAHAPDNRRTSTDLATVALVPLELIPEGLNPTFRDTDKTVISCGDLVVLLRSTDTDSARTALHRAGLSHSVISDERVRVSVARPVDLVSPAVSASPVAVVPDDRHEDAWAG